VWDAPSIGNLWSPAQRTSAYAYVPSTYIRAVPISDVQIVLRTSYEVAALSGPAGVEHR
jgi:hypothetical protein